MDKEKYDKVLMLMAMDITYEQDFGSRYIKQEVFDNLLKECGVTAPDGGYIEGRMIALMDKAQEELC
jgi:hypothetical protein